MDKVIFEKELSIFYISVDFKDYYNEKGKFIVVKVYLVVGLFISKDEIIIISSGVK